MPSAQPEVTGTISNVEVSPVQTPTTPTVTELAGQPVSTDYSLASSPNAPGGMGLSAEGFTDVRYRPDLAALEGRAVNYGVAEGIGGTPFDSGIQFGYSGTPGISSVGQAGGINPLGANIGQAGAISPLSA